MVSWKPSSSILSRVRGRRALAWRVRLPWRRPVSCQCPLREDGGRGPLLTVRWVGTVVVGSDRAGRRRPGGLEAGGLGRGLAPPLLGPVPVGAPARGTHGARERSPGPGRGAPSCRPGRAVFGAHLGRRDCRRVT